MKQQMLEQEVLKLRAYIARLEDAVIDETPRQWIMQQIIFPRRKEEGEE